MTNNTHDDIEAMDFETAFRSPVGKCLFLEGEDLTLNNFGTF